MTFGCILRWGSLMHPLSRGLQGWKIQNAALKKHFVSQANPIHVEQSKRESVISSRSILILLIQALLETALLDLISHFLRRHPSPRRRWRRGTDQWFALHPSDAMSRFVSRSHQAMRAIWE